MRKKKNLFHEKISLPTKRSYSVTATKHVLITQSHRKVPKGSTIARSFQSTFCCHVKFVNIALFAFLYPIYNIMNKFNCRQHYSMFHVYTRRLCCLCYIHFMYICLFKCTSFRHFWRKTSQPSQSTWAWVNSVQKNHITYDNLTKENIIKCVYLLDSYSSH